MYDPLEEHRFPKRHEFVVQECRVLHVREVICWLTDKQYRTAATLRLEGGLELVAKRCGAARRWHFLCPACRRPCEHLYLPPGEPEEPPAAVAGPPEADRSILSAEELAAGEREGGWFAVVARAIAREQSVRAQNLVNMPYLPLGNWRCRKCWNLNYASQHCGSTHPFRSQLPPRRALSRRRRVKEANRRREQQAEFSSAPQQPITA